MAKLDDAQRRSAVIAERIRQRTDVDVVVKSAVVG